MHQTSGVTSPHFSDKVCQSGQTVPRVTIVKPMKTKRTTYFVPPSITIFQNLLNSIINQIRSINIIKQNLNQIGLPFGNLTCQAIQIINSALIN